ncbi:(R)-2-hydroxyisocaproyl-CoA dehydratase activator protein [Desulfotomaculum arcticum]|uniref:(R)-2-hydroxyisocaproyl-CoA dehydratase activator protein n=1 Tax=Desulfotruncus arcticus DSM 17038 TaxID=1121424 RepID=A0A1I2ZLY0_9FIRM|nr:acyl-CoA dehydratase activase [Desulfotruncus arcticus]SFH38857.1 (R)-2-hydroxyisocaproyl-CoA dehydratase activator protein [Desulfotomaculum arcticum] [Desulfotruncus arcticus DSM 17038]
MAKFYLGVDIGSLTTKVVLINEAAEIVGRATGRSGYSGKEIALRLTADLLESNGLKNEDVVATVATGYGRVTFPADREISEITCQARGIAHLFNGVGTVIDIGGQDSKVIKLLPGGKVADFAMNDKCAAGTGRFLEVMAGALEVKVEDLGDLASQAGESCPISSICTVFAESEIISHISTGKAKPDIVAGVCDSVAARVASMTARTGLEQEVVFTGGVARNNGVVNALAKHLGCSLSVPPEPEITAALGAALSALGLSKN